MNKVEYQNEILTIEFAGYGTGNINYNELFDFLGENDIITASEIGEDCILMSNELFLFTHKDEQILKDTGKVQLERKCTLRDWVVEKNIPLDNNFVKWYNKEN